MVSVKDAILDEGALIDTPMLIYWADRRDVQRQNALT